jgi:hypothetical protein
MRLLIWKPGAYLKSAIFFGNLGTFAVSSFVDEPLLLDMDIMRGN